MRRRAAHVAAAALAATVMSGIAGAVYGTPTFVACLEILVPLAAASTLLAGWIATNRSQLGGLRRQVVLTALLMGLQAAIAVALFSKLMFISNEDALLMALVVASSAVTGAVVARVVSERALIDLHAVRRSLHDVAAGSRDVALRIDGDDELGRLAADVRAMVTRLTIEERARRELVAAVSHDLRTPVTTLQLITEGLEDGIFEPERTREQIVLIATHVRALGGLINDLFELSRLEAGDLRWSTEQVEMVELIHETVEALRPHAEACGVRVTAELDGTLAHAQGNPEKLQRVLFNLIQNAVRHTPPDGSVAVRAQATATRIEVQVADDGEGIADDDRDRVFEPFIQGTSRAARTDGAAGLGLAISRAIVEAHGGHIWLADTDLGTTVRFSLPAGREGAAGSSGSSQPVPSTVAEDRTRRESIGSL
jgi:signal transduction histidine kinase